jgi:ATP-dependent protease ClpP protease subunit
VSKEVLTKDDAEVLKILAEAEKFRMEGEAFAADRDLKAAEARKREAEARSAEYHAEQARVSRDQTLRQEKITLSANHYYHVFEFLSSVQEEAVQSCIAQMHIWHRDDPKCDMSIVMDSPGGSVIDGMHLFDQIITYSKRGWDTRGLIKGPKGTHSTKITVRGYAASMAGILLQAADHRVIGPQSFMMIHEVATFARGKIGEIKDEVEFVDKISENVVDIFVRRSAGKITPAKFKKLWDRKDVWLTAEEALSYGFVDEIG